MSSSDTHAERGATRPRSGTRQRLRRDWVGADSRSRRAVGTPREGGPTSRASGVGAIVAGERETERERERESWRVMVVVLLVVSSADIEGGIGIPPFGSTPVWHIPRRPLGRGGGGGTGGGDAVGGAVGARRILRDGRRVPGQQWQPGELVRLPHHRADRLCPMYQSVYI